MIYRPSPKLDAACVAVRATIAQGEAAGWSLRRLRAELRAAKAFFMGSSSTWYLAVVHVTGRGARKLRDPRHEVLDRMRKGKAA